MTQKKRRPSGRRFVITRNVNPAYFATGAAASVLPFIISSRAALNGLPSYQFGHWPSLASALPTDNATSRSWMMPSSFQVAASKWSPA